MSEQSFDRRRFEELLPFYVNGTLKAGDQDFMDHYLASNPEAKQQLAYEQSLQQALQQEIFQRAENAGLNKLLRQLGEERDHSGLPQKMTAWFREWQIKPAVAVMATLIVMQMGVIVAQQGMLNDSVATEYRGITGENVATPDFKLIIKPEAAYSELATLLQTNGCRIVSGPSEAGELWIASDKRVPADELQRRLLRSGLVDDVLPVGNKT